MKILSLGLDNSILNKNSHLAGRAFEYGEMVEKYTVVVPAQEDKERVLSDKVRVYGQGGSNKAIKLFRVFRLAKRLLQEEKYDLITVQDQYFLGWLTLKLARKFKIGLEIQIHGFEKFFGWRKMIAKFVIPRADAVRTVSQRLKKELVSNFGVKEEKITVVPIYVERVTHNVERVTHNDKFIFLTVGRLVPVKNIEMQIEALATIVKQFPGTKLLVVGDGAERKKLEQICCALCVARYVTFLGWQSDLEKFYAQADALLLTSNYEGWGMVIIEAASFGLPIIMTDVGCAGEVIKNGESGIIIPVGGRKELEEAMRRIMGDENLRKRLGEGAKRAVEKLPSKEETLELYKESWKKACRMV
ncbi:MAG: glycosyltransferase family 4 protein [Patescibacteria group bacterium]|nr:glycosyltransferase family 4 protein [Patescibacteria group bacterium]